MPLVHAGTALEEPAEYFHEPNIYPTSNPSRRDHTTTSSVKVRALPYSNSYQSALDTGDTQTAAAALPRRGNLTVIVVQHLLESFLAVTDPVRIRHRSVRADL